MAFEVDDLEAAIAGKHVLVQPNSPSGSVTVAFILDDGAPIEFLQFARLGLPFRTRNPGSRA